ncbi:ankyrin repeat domain-containing protein, partial [Legionella shakespearei]
GGGEHLSEKGTSLYSHWAKVEPEETIRQKVVDALAKYYEDMAALEGKEENYLEVIRIIVTCVQKIEQDHPFRDGNGRTAYALLNLMLLQNKLPPVILEDPNYLDGYAPDELVDEVLKGMSNFAHVKKYGTYPSGKSTVEIIRHNVEESRNNPKMLKSIRIDFLRAATVGNTELLRQYLENGIDPSLVTDDYGNTALTLAVFYGHLDCIRELIHLKPEFIDIPGQDNATALYLAAYNGHTEVVDYLLEKGADANIKSIYGLKPAEIAAQRGHSGLVSRLQQQEQHSSEFMDIDEDNTRKHSIFFRGFIPDQQAESSVAAVQKLLDGKTKDINLKKLHNALVTLDLHKNQVLHYTQIAGRLFDLLESATIYYDNYRDKLSLNELKELYHLIKRERGQHNSDLANSGSFPLEEKILMSFIRGTSHSNWDSLMKHIQDTYEAVTLQKLNEEQVFSLLFNENNAFILEHFFGEYNFETRLEEFKKKYPQHCELFFNFLAMNLDTVLLKRVKHVFDLEKLLKIFADENQQERILTRVVANKELFQACLKNAYDFKTLANAAPVFKEQLFTRLIGDDVLLSRVFKSSWDLDNLLKVFSTPEQQEGILSRVFARKELFQVCLKDEHDFSRIEKVVPDVKARLLAYDKLRDKRKRKEYEPEFFKEDVDMAEDLPKKNHEPPQYGN